MTKKRILIGVAVFVAAILFHNAMMADKASLCSSGSMTIEQC